MGGALAYQISPLVVPYVTPSTQVVPTILVPDLTRLITRCSPDPICGGTYGNIYRCIYGPDGDVEVRADFTFLSHSVMYPSFNRVSLDILERARNLEEAATF